MRGGPNDFGDAADGNRGTAKCACTGTAEAIGLEGGNSTRGLDVAKGLEGTIPRCCH